MSEPDYVKEQKVKYVTDIQWAIIDLVGTSAEVAEGAYRIGRVLLNNKGKQQGTREVNAQLGGIQPGDLTLLNLSKVEIEELLNSMESLENKLNKLKKISERVIKLNK